MKLFEKGGSTIRIFALLLVGYLLFSVAPAPAAPKFIIFDANKHMLINRVHKQSWTIRYHFVDCPPITAEQKAHYEQVTTKFIQIWLQPLREYTKRPIVDDFRYQEKSRQASGDYDLGISVICKFANPRAYYLRRWIDHHMSEFHLTYRWMAALTHELGHLFGLADTYLLPEDWGKPGATTGGSELTVGSQPTSFMSGASNLFIFGLENMLAEIDKQVALDQPITLSEDDKNGIIWAYKHNVEGVRRDDCSLFPEYRWEDAPPWGVNRPHGGCVPKYPLIFALKHHRQHDAVLILKEDAGLAVNAQDPEGLTALHWAVLNNYRKVIAQLLDHPQIKPHLRDKAGKTAADLARETGHADIAALILAHPRALSVSSARTLTTTWGHLKGNRDNY